MFKWLKEWGEEVKNRFQAVVPGYFGGGWVSSGYFTNPVATTVLFDTGSLPAGIYDFSIALSTSVAFGITYGELQHRNAANTTTLKSFRVGQFSVRFTQFKMRLYKLGDGERLRMYNNTNYTGTVQAGCLYTRRFPLKRGQ